MSTLRNALSGICSALLLAFVTVGFCLLYCMTWIFGGRAWREFLTGRDLEHD